MPEPRKNLRPIIPQPGSSRDPATFVGRKATTQQARRKLLAGTDLLLSDPRRMGKTYWMRYFCATTTDFTPVFVDYEGVSSTQEFLLRTVEALKHVSALADKARSWLSSLFDNFEITATTGPVGMKKTFENSSPIKLLTDVVMGLDDREAGERRPVLICMDEVPLAIQTIAKMGSPIEARTLLQQLRELRQSTRFIRWIVAGSIGFHHVLRECGTTVGVLNDLDNLPLGPLSHDDAVELTQRLFLGIGRTPDHSAIMRMVEDTGGIPYLIQKLASSIQFPFIDIPTTGTVTADIVDEVFEAWIDDRDESKDVTHFLTRIEDYYGTDSPLAHEILRTVLTAGSIPRDELVGKVSASDHVDQVIEDLIADHYLIEKDAALTWRYPVIRHIYARRYAIADRGEEK